MRLALPTPDSVMRVSSAAASASSVWDSRGRQAAPPQTHRLIAAVQF
jgi:hypothetical protein